jgi:hypothetical protein
MARSRREFGRVRRLPSGRWQARYRSPDGVDRPAPNTFGTRREADRWLASVTAEIEHGRWIDPSAGEVPLSEWARQWLTNKPHMKPTTKQLYDWVLGKYLLPYLADVPIGQITPALVRRWYAEISRIGGVTPVRQAYSILRAMMATAVTDEILVRNPCVLRGIATAAPERPVATLQQVVALAGGRPSPLSRVDPDRDVVERALGRTRRAHTRPARPSARTDANRPAARRAPRLQAEVRYPEVRRRHPHRSSATAPHP